MQTVNATDYRDIAKPSSPQLSPDGNRVAFVRTQPESGDSYEATVHVVGLGESESGAFTAATGVDSQPQWSPSGDRLAFVSTREDDSQVWVMPTDGGEARRVTDVVGTIEEFAWRPDGSAIAFTQSTTPTEREAGLDLGVGDAAYERETPDPRVVDRLVYRAGAEYFDGRRSHVYLLDFDDSVERLTDGEYDHRTPEWGDADTLYYTVKRTDDPDDNVEHDIDAFDVDSGSVETVLTTTDWQPALSVVGPHLAYTQTPPEKTSMRQTNVVVYDRERDRTTTLTADLDRTVAADTDIEWDPAGEFLYFLTPDEGRVVLRRAAVDTTPQIVVETGHLDGFSVGESVVAHTKSEWDHPGDVFVTTPRGADEKRLTRLNHAYLDGRAVGRPEELRFEGGDGEVQGWVLKPPAFDPEERYPLAVEIHGGPHAMWSTAETMWHEFQTLAARGYVVFWCNPRGSTGYGEAFAMAIEREWGEITAEDVLAGVETVTEYEYVDETNQFVTGGSFGGFMTAWLVGHTDRFAGAVAQRGVYELLSFYGSTDAFKLVEWDFGTTPWDDPEFLWTQSPVAHADQVDTPTLVLHADSDFRVPVNNGEFFYLALKKHGVETRLVRYAREGHELSRSGEPDHVVDRLERIARWFDGYSEHHDAPRALERGEAGLSTSSDESSTDDEVRNEH